MYPNLNAELTRNNKNQSDVMKALGLNSLSTISEKMNGKRDFKLKECKKIISDVLPGNTLDYLFKTKEDINTKGE